MGDAWEDLREDARRFANDFPGVLHVLYYASTGGWGWEGDDTAWMEHCIRLMRDARGCHPPDWLRWATETHQAASSPAHLDHGTTNWPRGVGSALTLASANAQSNIKHTFDYTFGRPQEKSEMRTRWDALADRLWRLAFDRLAIFLPEQAFGEGPPREAPGLAAIRFREDEPIAPTLDEQATDVLLHWLAWSGKVCGLSAKVLIGTEGTDRWKTQEPRPQVQRPDHLDKGWPALPQGDEERWWKPEGWAWSRIANAGEALIAAIDWLQPKGRTHRKLSEGEREGLIADYLRKYPRATRDGCSEALGIPTGTVSKSRAWRAHTASVKRETNARRSLSKGVGGVGDPTE